MEDKIELTHFNYQNYIPINIIAFKYAYSGAQGDPGGVVIMNNEGQIFYYNYLDGNLTQDEINKICPVIKDNDITELKEKYKEINLGMGNRLFVKNTFYPEVEEVINEVEQPSNLYRAWVGLFLDVLKK